MGRFGQNTHQLNRSDIDCDDRLRPYKHWVCNDLAGPSSVYVKASTPINVRMVNFGANRQWGIRIFPLDDPTTPNTKEGHEWFVSLKPIPSNVGIIKRTTNILTDMQRLLFLPIRRDIASQEWPNVITISNQGKKNFAYYSGEIQMQLFSQKIIEMDVVYNCPLERIDIRLSPLIEPYLSFCSKEDESDGWNLKINPEKNLISTARVLNDVRRKEKVQKMSAIDKHLESLKKLNEDFIIMSDKHKELFKEIDEILNS